MERARRGKRPLEDGTACLPAPKRINSFLEEQALSDHDLAFRMQLNEALAASLGINSVEFYFDEPGSSQIGEIQEVLNVQNSEVEALQQKTLDQKVACEEAKRIKEELKVRYHDGEFARAILEMPEEEWQDRGGLFECPIGKDQNEVLEGWFQVHFKGVTSWNGRASKVGIGVVISDPQGHALTELGKCLNSTMGGTLAWYAALLEGVNIACLFGARNVQAYVDYKVIYNQMLGHWKTSKKDVELQNQVKEQADKLDAFQLKLIRADENRVAENLARKAIAKVNSDNACSSDTKYGHCIICMEDKLVTEMVYLKECSHNFCSICISQHAEQRVMSGQIPVACPDLECKKALSADECKPLLSNNSFNLLTRKMVEKCIPEALRVYCPYSSCSAFMSKDGLGLDTSFGCAECPECHRLLCINCRVPWHTNMSCAAYQDAMDEKLFKLAEKRSWKQCRQCGCMIELATGCHHITCRCGYEFCYVCGKQWVKKKPTCHCKLWEEVNILGP